MRKEEAIYGVIQYHSLTVNTTKRHLQDWLILVRILYTPEQMVLNNEKPTAFSLAKCTKVIQDLKESDDLSLKIFTSENESSFHLVEGNLLEKHLFSRNVFLTHKETITSYVAFQMKTKGLFGYLRSYDEFLYNNEENVQLRRKFEDSETIAGHPKIRIDDEVFIDCNQFAGYDIFYKGFCLTSCWQMYFSQRYHQIIPLRIIEEVQQVERVVKLSDEVIMVELYRDPFKWEDPLNLAYQRLFRDQMGIDQLAWNNGVGILREPFIEYAYSDNMIQTVSYQNEKLQPTNKKAATHFVTRTYDILRGQYQERRIKGVLNAQAYFPWVDEQGMKMMNYLVINPSYALDDGLAAYHFYIRNYLEVEVSDARYHEYTAILNIYIPDELLVKIPYEQLKQRMPDVQMSHLKKRKNRSFCNLKKGNNHLKVNFVPFTALAQIKSELTSR